MTLPPDADSRYRRAVNVWDSLWRAQYRYQTVTDRYSQVLDSDDNEVTAAPGYTRSFSHLVAGLFSRQTPGYTSDDNGPLDPQELSDLLFELVSKAAGYGCVVQRPVSDGVAWRPSVVAPSQFTIRWAHRRPAEIVVWEHADDPFVDDEHAGLALLETWTPNPSGPGQVVTEVWRTQTTGGKTKLTKQVPVDNPGVYDGHPFVVSAANDSIPRDMMPFVWAWEDFGPVPLWYTAEHVVVGLARLWDQEQDDAEMARHRIAMPVDLINRADVLADATGTVLARPGFQKHDNILGLSSSMSAEHGPTGGVTQIDFSDDLVQRERIERRENALLEMVGINPASIGRNVSGRSDSGVAKRADNQMTMNTISSPARRVEQVMTATVQQLTRLNPGTGAPTIQVAVYEGLKDHPLDSAEQARALRDAEAASTRTLVQTAHPSWTPEQVDEEVERMQAEARAIAPLEF